MKPLTIEEIKALQPGDWVWVIDVVSNLDNTYHLSDTYLKIYSIDDAEIKFYMQNCPATLHRSFCRNINANAFIFKNKEQVGDFTCKLMDYVESGNYDYYSKAYDLLENYAEGE